MHGERPTHVVTGFYNNTLANLTNPLHACYRAAGGMITGTPQGSILGPLFVSILINDLVNCSTKFQFLMYADDTTIYFQDISSFNLNDFPLINREIEINSELEKVNTWLKLNKLAINVDKSKCMFFQKRRSITPLKFLMNNNRAIDMSFTILTI